MSDIFPTGNVEQNVNKYGEILYGDSYTSGTIHFGFNQDLIKFLNVFEGEYGELETLELANDLAMYVNNNQLPLHPILRLHQLFETIRDSAEQVLNLESDLLDQCLILSQSENLQVQKWIIALSKSLKIAETTPDILSTYLNVVIRNKKRLAELDIQADKIRSEKHQIIDTVNSLADSFLPPSNFY